MKLRGTLYSGEKVLVSTRSHLSFLLPAGIYGFIAVTAFSFASAIYNSSFFFGILGYLFVLWFGWLCFKGLLRWVNTGFILTSYRLVVQRGLLFRTSVSIPLENISGVDAKSSLTRAGASARLSVHALGRVYVLRQVPRGGEFSQAVRAAQDALLAARPPFQTGYRGF